MHFMKWVGELSKGDLECIYPVFKPKRFEPLQAADFAGWAKRYAVKQALAGTFSEFEPCLVAVMRIPHDYGMVDRDRLTEHVDLFGVPKRDVWKTLSQKEQSKWRPAAFAQGTLYRASEKPQPGADRL
jgi:hypothetical protein